MELIKGTELSPPTTTAYTSLPAPGEGIWEGGGNDITGRVPGSLPSPCPARCDHAGAAGRRRGSGPLPAPPQGAAAKSDGEEPEQPAPACRPPSLPRFQPKLGAPPSQHRALREVKPFLPSTPQKKTSLVFTTGSSRMTETDPAGLRWKLVFQLEDFTLQFPPGAGLRRDASSLPGAAAFAVWEGHAATAPDRVAKTLLNING